MGSRYLPFFGYRLKPHDRLVRVVALDRPTYARAYAIVDIGDGEFDVLYQSAGTATNQDYAPAELGQGLRWVGVVHRIEVFERRGMDGPRVGQARKEWHSEGEAIAGLEDLQDRWPEVSEWWDDDDDC